MPRLWPMKNGSYTISSRFAGRTNPVTGRAENHSGTDFAARDGTPFYACAGGTVQHIGAAGGYGQWIVIDHPASEGGGCTEYGHMWNAFATGLKAGQWVNAGQLLGYVGSNGQSTGPHLHLTVWEAGHGGRRIDPETWLAASGWPGEAPVAPPAPPTAPSPVTYVLDVSQWQNPISLRAAKADGIAGVILRTNDGTYLDSAFRSHLADARANDLPVSAYWFVRRPNEGTSIAAQADVVARQLAGHGDIGVWLDVESPGGMDRATVYEARDALKARGIRVIGIYSTAGYWESLRGGEPPAADFGAVWVANFGPDRKGGFRDIYPGNGDRVWDYPLGNRTPDLWQFTQHGRIPSYGASLDVNAYRGTPAQLKGLFEGRPTGEDWFDMATEAELRKIVREEVARYCGPIGHDVKRVAVQMGMDADDDGFGRVPGWIQGGYRSFYDLLSAVGAAVGVTRTKDTLPELPTGARNPKLKG